MAKQSKSGYECRCYDCGRYFNNEDIRWVEEDRGEFWGVPCTERMAYCPYCKYGDVGDAYEVDREIGSEYEKEYLEEEEEL